MRLAALLAAAVLPVSAVWAGDSPQRVGFQGKLLDTQNNPKTGTYDITFRIFDVPSGGSALWSETQGGVPVTNGVFSVQLGTVTLIPAGLFNATSRYLEIQVSPDPAMSPRQQLLMAPYAFRALVADDLVPGNTSYVQVATELQAGSSFHVSSATVEGKFLAMGLSSFTASGNTTFSVVTASGVRVQGGTLRVEGSGGVDAAGQVSGATVRAATDLLLPQGSASTAEGAARWNAGTDTLAVGTGGASKTMADTDSSQTLTNKTLSSTGGNTVDATRVQGRTLSSNAPLNGMVMEFNAGAAQWEPNYGATASVAAVPFAPNGALANGVLLADDIYVVPVFVTGVMSLNQFRYNIGTSVNGTGNIGLYSASGVLAAKGAAGSLACSGTGYKSIAVQGAPVVIQPGQYYLAWTATASCRPYGVNLGVAVMKSLGSYVRTSGGTDLPDSITLSAMTEGGIVPFMSMNE